MGGSRDRAGRRSPGPQPARRVVSEEVRSAFALRGVGAISQFFTAAEFIRLCRHVDRKIRLATFQSMAGDTQVSGAPCEYGDAEAERLLRVKASYLCDLLQLDLVPTYSYMRLYRPGDRLPPHRDRPACEITVSAPLAADCGWPLRILVEGSPFEFAPPARDAVVFRGHELLHWRETLSGNRPVAQVLLHYVQRRGPCQSWAYDRRPYPPAE